MTVQITDQDFDAQVLKNEGLVLVDFWAPWCGPCKMLGPIIEQVADEHAGQVKVAKLNVDQNPNTARRYRIMGIPTMLLFKNGQKVAELVGVRPKAEIAALITQWSKAA